MDFYLFDYKMFLTGQFFSGIFFGIAIMLGVKLVFRTEIEKRRRALSIHRFKRMKYLIDRHLSMLKEVMWFKKRYMITIDGIKQLEKDNGELCDVVEDLSGAKSNLQTENKKLLAERNHYYIECDRLKAENIRLTSPAYVRSEKYISKEGKIE